MITLLVISTILLILFVDAYRKQERAKVLAYNRKILETLDAE